jgi:acyl-CoA thioesterase
VKSSTSAGTRFDRTTAIRRVSVEPLRYAAELDESWASLRGVHGGYCSALLVRAAEESFPDRAVRTVATSFLRPTAIGPAEIDVDVVRTGRSFTTVAAALRQEGRVALTSRITMLRPVVGAEWTRAVASRPAAVAACSSFTPPPSIRHFEQAELLIDPETVPNGDAEDARIAGHVRPIEARPLDAAWLTMIGDWFPPSPFRRLLPPTGGVSIDYTVHVHRTLPWTPDLWLEGVFDAGTSVDGIALEHGTLATPDGRPVAETFHTRWTA